MTKLKLGLPNFGNTCYINSILQCLRYSKPLVFMLRDHRVTKKKNDKKEELFDSFVELLYADADSRELYLFIQNLSLCNSQFRLLKQCDAHELYLYIIDNFFEMFPKLNNPFKGALKSTVICNVCGCNSINSAPFISLSLEMDHKEEKQSITSMLEKYLSYEDLEAPIECLKCKSRQPSKKILEIVDCPTLAVIHLKRFNGMRKNNVEVKIEKKIKINTTTYKLSCICNHSGTLYGGHYTSTCLRKDEMWVVCNDNNINNIQDLPTSTRLPYILFYQAI